MSLQVAGFQADAYRVNTEVYEGPLDLLLQLIERAELDITRLAIAQVTDQYLDYLESMEFKDPAEVSAFLVMAARLVQIKSQALLPSSPPVEAQEEDQENSAEALARQLIQYRRFKQLGSVLDERQKSGLRTYLRLSMPVPRLDARLDLGGLNMLDLAMAARNVFIEEINLPELSTVVSMPRITIREKIHAIISLLRQKGPSTFKSALDQPSRLEAVITFLAMLELIKRRVVIAQQPGLFEDIQLTPIGEWDDSTDAELEFGE